MNIFRLNFFFYLAYNYILLPLVTPLKCSDAQSLVEYENKRPLKEIKTWEVSCNSLW